MKCNICRQEIHADCDYNQGRCPHRKPMFEFGKKSAESNAEYQCFCYNCNKDRKTEQGWPWVATRMILCPECGNKRCPHSTDHNLECTGSNEPGQPGSRYQ